MDEQALMRSDQLAAELGIPTATLGQWRYLGKGPPYIKIGASVRYRRGDVDEWIDAQRVDVGRHDPTTGERS